MMHEILKKVWEEEQMTEEWKKVRSSPYTSKTTHSRTDEFPIKVGLHQGSGQSQCLFIIVLDVISEEFRCGLTCELLLVTI